MIRKYFCIAAVQTAVSYEFSEFHISAPARKLCVDIGDYLYCVVWEERLGLLRQFSDSLSLVDIEADDHIEAYYLLLCINIKSVEL